MEDLTGIKTGLAPGTTETIEKRGVPKEKEFEKLYDVFFRDQLTGAPGRLHRSVGIGPRGESETEPVILPLIPANLIVEIPQGLGGGEAYYKISKPEDAEEAKNKLLLGTISSSGRGIMIVDLVPKTEISKLEELGYKVVHIDQVQQELLKDEKTPTQPRKKTASETARIKRPEVKAPIGFSEIWEYDPTAPSESNIGLVYRAKDINDKKGTPLALPPLKQLMTDFSKHPILEIEIPEELRFKPKEDRAYFSPIIGKLLLAQAQSAYKQATGSEPTNVLLVTRVSPASVENSKYEKVNVNKALREYIEKATIPRKAA